MHTQCTFAPEGGSVSQARQFVRGALESWNAEDITDEAVLATSELVTNAVIHAGTPVKVALDLDAQGLLIEVQDLHPNRTLSLGVGNADEDSEHGRGLFIAASLATAWGVDYAAGAKRVWLRLDRAHTPATPVAPVATTELDDSGVAVIGLDRDQRVVSWDQDAEKMSGWTAEEVLGRPWAELVESLDGLAVTGRRSDVPKWGDAQWQGLCALRCRTGAPAEVFVSRTSGGAGQGAIVLMVPASRRSLLEWPAPQPRSNGVGDDPVGLREDSLNRLGVQAYLDLVVERARDRLDGQAAYLLLIRDLDVDFEVTAVSGLDGALRGLRLEHGTAGAPDMRNPHLPVVMTDVDPEDVSWLRDKELRSLLVSPVVMEGRVIGALGVASERPAGFDDEQAVLLQRIADSTAPGADRARLRSSERERRGWLTFIAESSDLLAGSLDQDMTMAITGQVVVPRLANWCAVYLDDSRGQPILQQLWHRDERSVASLRAALETIPPEDLSQSGDERLRGSVQNFPLIARGHRIGVLTMGRAEGNPLHGEALVVAESLARRAALAIDNARAHHELQTVGEALQRSLLPVSIPTAPTFEVGVVYEAAGEQTLAGGDFYDLFPVDAGRWCFAVGDVCGTGAEAAAVTGLARHTIRALVLAGFPVASALERLNTAILEEGERSRFLTMVCGTLEPTSRGRLRMSMVSAGHPPPFVVRRTGSVDQVGRPQSLLGVQEKASFVADEILLERGDLVVMVTDGVLERREGQRMLGEEGLIAELVQVAELPAQAVAARIKRLVADFTDVPPADDMAVLAIRVRPGG